MRRHINFAYKIAKKSTHRCHKLGAIIIRGGAIISFAHNLRGSAGTFHQDSAPQGHAEKRAILPHMNLTGTTIIVIRLSGGCSRPCPDCFKAIQAAGIKKVAYVNEDRQFVIEKVK